MYRKRVKESMVAGPYNPDKRLSFGDMIEAELGKRLQSGRLSPVIYNKALDLMRRRERPLTGIYRGRVRGLDAAVAFLVNKCR